MGQVIRSRISPDHAPDQHESRIPRYFVSLLEVQTADHEQKGPYGKERREAGDGALEHYEEERCEEDVGWTRSEAWCSSCVVCLG